MSFKLSKIYSNKSTRSMDTGKELLELWLNLGSMEAARVEFNAIHGATDYINYAGNASRRIRYWLCRNTDEAMKMIQEANPDIPLKQIQEKMTFYATRELKDIDRFRVWVKEHPWAEQFKDDYEQWFQARL